jgi:hypothetical protein
VQNAPIYYACLRETRRIKDISDPSGDTLAAIPALLRIHAAHVADGEVACGYARKDGDLAEPDRDWFGVLPGEIPCEACRAAIRPAKA